MKKLIFLLFISSALFAQQQNLTPQQIQQQLNEAEALFKRAEGMFNPWYTGPLLTPSATMVPPGMMSTQPYIFITDTYAVFDRHRNSHTLKNSVISFNPAGGPVAQIGVTNHFDVTISSQAFVNWQAGRHGGGVGDTSLAIGFCMQDQTPWVPKAKFVIKQSFPTGRYQHLNHDGLGLGATGSGCYRTTFGFATGKLLFWETQHPVNTRLFFGYTVSQAAKVHGFNTYGGGFGTRARVRPGNEITADAGIEVSLTQSWVVCFDLAYTAQNATKFSGNPGTTATGDIAPLGKGYSDNLSLAPGIEYNLNDHSGFVFGGWFSVYGRNSGNFGSGIASFYYVFGVN